MKIELIAKQPLKFDGKVLKKGSRFLAKPGEARVLLWLGRAAAVEPIPAAPVEVDKPKRAYKRRDLQAEAPSFPVEAKIFEFPKSAPAVVDLSGLPPFTE